MTTTKINLDKICVGQFAGAHGVRGLVKLRSFSADPNAIFGYTPLTSEDGETTIQIELKSAAKDMFIVAVDGIATKEQADALRGDRLYIARDLLPPTRDNEYYETELVGLMVVDDDAKEYGKVMATHDYGAGVFLEIGTNKQDSFMLPFRNENVPIVDLKNGRVIIAMPEGWLTDHTKKPLPGSEA